MIWFTSDPHFGHHNVIKYCARPFSGIAEMERELIERFNARVQPTDTVYFLGDIFFCGVTRAKEIMKKFNGYKILIRGNHDRGAAKMKEIGFDEVHEKLEVDIEGIHLKLCHFPYKPYTGDIPDHVLETVEKVKKEQRQTGKDSSLQIDEVLNNYSEAGTITKEQAQRLSSYDMRFFDRRFENKGSWLLCGHIHEKWSEKDRMINVGVDVRNFAPISIDEIKDIINAGPRVKKENS